MVNENELGIMCLDWFYLFGTQGNYVNLHLKDFGIRELNIITNEILDFNRHMNQNDMTIFLLIFI